MTLIEFLESKGLLEGFIDNIIAYNTEDFSTECIKNLKNNTLDMVSAFIWANAYHQPKDKMWWEVDQEYEAQK